MKIVENFKNMKNWETYDPWLTVYVFDESDCIGASLAGFWAEGLVNFVLLKGLRTVALVWKLDAGRFVEGTGVST